MAQVISSFLVGLGFDYDKKGAKEIEAGIDSIKSKAIQLGGVMAGAFGTKAFTADFANAQNMLGDFSSVFGGSAEDIQAMGSALSTVGGDLNSFMSDLATIQRLRAGAEVGEVGFVADFGRAGGDANAIIEAENALDAFISIADQFQRSTGEQRINMASALGLDNSSLRLLSLGSSEIDDLLGKFKEVRPVTEQMTGAAREFRAEWVEVKSNIGAVGDAISAEVLPVLNSALSLVNDIFDEDRMSILSGIGEGFSAFFQSGDKTAADRAEALGLPEWLFTTDINDTGRAMGVPDFMTAPISSLMPTPAYNAASTFAPAPFPAAQPRESQFRPAPFSAAGQQSQPIQIRNEVVLDGRVIDSRVHDVVGQMGTTTIEEFSTNTRG